MQSNMRKGLRELNKMDPKTFLKARCPIRATPKRVHVNSQNFTVISCLKGQKRYIKPVVLSRAPV